MWPHWKDTRVAGTAYGHLLKECDITWGKVIHMRSAGIEFASLQGELDGGAVSTMSKHQTSKLEKLYLTEFHPPFLRVMSGHTKEEQYHVLCTLLAYPMCEQKLAELIFPKLSLWQLQYRSPNGDHSKAVHNFLF